MTKPPTRRLTRSTAAGLQILQPRRQSREDREVANKAKIRCRPSPVRQRFHRRWRRLRAYPLADHIESFVAVKKVKSRVPYPGDRERGRSQARRSGHPWRTGCVQRLGGGEDSDLYSGRLRIGGKRHVAAFAFKGPGEPGPLVPGRMGKNGDQMGRLFRQIADVFFFQHWREIKPNVTEMMRSFAVAKSVSTGNLIRYGIIDGVDTERLRRAYPSKFKPKIGAANGPRLQSPEPHATEANSRTVLSGRGRNRLLHVKSGSSRSALVIIRHRQPIAKFLPTWWVNGYQQRWPAACQLLVLTGCECAHAALWLSHCNYCTFPGNASRSLKYCRFCSSGRRSPSIEAAARLVRAKRSCQPGARGWAAKQLVEASSVARKVKAVERIRRAPRSSAARAPSRMDRKNGSLPTSIRHSTVSQRPRRSRSVSARQQAGAGPRNGPPGSCDPPHHPFGAQLLDRLGRVAQLTQNPVGVLAERRRAPADLQRRARELHRLVRRGRAWAGRDNRSPWRKSAALTCGSSSACCGV